MDGNNRSIAGSTNYMVTCPRCANQFELSETFRAHFEKEKRKEVEDAVRESEAGIRAEVEQAFQKEQAESAKQVEDLEAQLQANQEAQEKREAEIRADAEKAFQEKRAESEKQVKDLEARLQANQKAQEKREAEIRAEAKDKASSTFEIERGEWALEKQRLEKNMADMQRQLGQKSVELQGEALEVFLKHLLETEFPFDAIEDIGRGQRGADLTQTVNDARLGSCGILVWEAKRTKHWNDSWIEKIKQDADRVSADLRIIVSEALPSDISVFALKDGVWVSSIDGAIPLANALRSQLIEITRLSRAAQGKGLKMDAIYQYVTSPRFGESIQRMLETWKALNEQLESEKRSMNRQWSTRRKQLDNMQYLTIELFTDFEAIVGQEIAQVPGLELEALPPGDDG